MSVSGSQSEIVETESVTSIHTEVRESATSPTGNQSTLRKFRKSFSLRLSRRPSQDDTNNEVWKRPTIDKKKHSGKNNKQITTSLFHDCDFFFQEEQDVDSPVAEQTSPKFRFGPLVWRASRERNNKKGAANKAARNAKCNSGDSGVQVRRYFYDSINISNPTYDVSCALIWSRMCYWGFGFSPFYWP